MTSVSMLQNKDVLEEITMPSVRLTCSHDAKLAEKCSYFSGDWRNFSELMSARQHKYVLIWSCNVKVIAGTIDLIYTWVLLRLWPVPTICKSFVLRQVQAYHARNQMSFLYLRFDNSQFSQLLSIFIGNWVNSWIFSWLKLLSH